MLVKKFVVTQNRSLDAVDVSGIRYISIYYVTLVAT